MTDSAPAHIIFTLREHDKDGIGQVLSASEQKQQRSRGCRRRLIFKRQQKLAGLSSCAQGWEHDTRSSIHAASGSICCLITGPHAMFWLSFACFSYGRACDSRKALIQVEKMGRRRTLVPRNCGGAVVPVFSPTAYTRAAATRGRCHPTSHSIVPHIVASFRPENMIFETLQGTRIV